jgi:hypothetical protein
VSTQNSTFDNNPDNNPDDNHDGGFDPADDSGAIESTQRERQPLSVMHLVMGLVFLGIAGLWGLHAADVIGSVDVEWLVPLIFVVAGAAGLLASATKNLGGRSTRST